jgi:hypothetical protein
VIGGAHGHPGDAGAGCGDCIRLTRDKKLPSLNHVPGYSDGQSTWVSLNDSISSVNIWLGE